MSAPGQRGAALLIAILSVAIATLLIAGLLDLGEAGLARTRNVTRAAQADALALGLEGWARDLLRRDAANDGGDDSASDLWAQPLPPTPVEGGTLAGRIRDRNGCFNLNNLVAGDVPVGRDLARFRRLLVALRLEPALAEAVLDWLDPDFIPGNRGAEDAAYLAAQPAYRAANRAFADVSELRAVRGFAPRVYATLAPHVCALPSRTALNVNTATVPVLMALDDAITRPVAERLAREGAAEYANLGAFAEALQRAGVAAIDYGGLDVRSDYFEAGARIELDGIVFARSALILRGREGIRAVARARVQ
jgi:general secretion pathway protein K